MPGVFLHLYKDSTFLAYKWYVEFSAMPILLLSSALTVGDTYTIKVGFMFVDSHPAKDYTLSIYSKVPIDIKDSDGQTNMLHNNGSSPSGWRQSYNEAYPDDVFDNPTDSDTDD